MTTTIYINGAKNILTTDHSASSYGIPVLVDASGAVLSANDRIGSLPAGEAAFRGIQSDWETREVSGCLMTEEEVALVTRFRDSAAPEVLPAATMTDEDHAFVLKALGL